MAALLTACGGFLLGVLWMDLLFDVQVLGPDPQRRRRIDRAYYRRVTTEAYPMNRLIGAVMLVTLGVAIYGLARQPDQRRIGVTGAGARHRPDRTGPGARLPNAVRLGSGADPPAAQLELARAICLDHVVCLLLMSGFVVVMIAVARDAGRGLALGRCDGTTVPRCPHPSGGDSPHWAGVFRRHRREPDLASGLDRPRTDSSPRRSGIRPRRDGVGVSRLPARQRQLPASRRRRRARRRPRVWSRRSRVCLRARGTRPARRHAAT